MSKIIAKAWMDQVTQSVQTLDIEKHINLISKHVNLTGIPGFEVIGYEDWVAQCRHEFQHKLVKSVEYQGYKALASNATRVMFQTLEKVVSSDGEIHQQGIEVLLEQESDQVWRVIQERVMDEDETRDGGLLE